MCQDRVATADQPAVLLVPGTTLTPAEFEWNYQPALTQAGIPWCTVEPPGRMMLDIQDSAEYVVHAIREVRRRSGHRVDVVGHSQGGMIGRWALKWWPDTRRKVDDLIGLAPSNHGSAVADGVCAARTCAAAIWQQGRGSAFMRALNADAETFAGVSYTSVYSDLDEVVVPNGPPTPSSALRTGDGARSNVRLQDVCPLSTAEHLTTGTSDPVAWAAARDALDHPGPADVQRIDRAVCARAFMPGVDPTTVLGDLAELGAGVLQGLSGGPQLPAEPSLRCYVTRTCTGSVASPRCVVPKLRGKTRRQARRAIVRAGCSVGRVRGRGGKVVRQRPRAGKTRTSGTRVKIRLK